MWKEKDEKQFELQKMQKQRKRDKIKLLKKEIASVNMCLYYIV